MFAIGSRWLFVLIKFFIICVGDRVVIGRVPGHRPIQGYWKPLKFSSIDLPFANFAENGIGHGPVNRQPQPSADFVFPAKVLVPLPESLNNKFPAQDQVSKGNRHNYSDTVVMNEAAPENSRNSIGLILPFVHEIRRRQLMPIILKRCRAGYQHDPAGICQQIK